MPDDTQMLRVMALHALAYCERLYYLEEVEELRVADHAVYAGRRLHQQLEADIDEGAIETFELASDTLGIRGKVDCLRQRDGALIPYEHKKGRSRGGPDGAEAWDSDRLQAIAYGHLVADCLGVEIPEVRVRYHADRKLVRIPLGPDTHADLLAAVQRAADLAGHLERPAIASNERLCTHCSLAPVCLPEEERRAEDPEHDTIRLFPPTQDRQSLHVTEAGARVGRSASELVVTARDGTTHRVGFRSIDQIVLHGHVQLTTQALHACQAFDVGVHWLTGGGRHVASAQLGRATVQRRLRQFQALADDAFTLPLARRLVEAKITAQLRFLLRTTRGEPRIDAVQTAIDGVRLALTALPDAASPDVLRGHEGLAARHYFAALAAITAARLPPELHLDGRSRRPPTDRVNALLSFAYALLLTDATAGILAAGLDPCFGFFHTPRSAAYPLALDLMELFRVPMVDMPVLAALARQTFDPAEDFRTIGKQVWLSDEGRKKLISLYERRKQDTWKHPAIGYSLTYDRLIELEARLLEKEWTGKPGLFATMRLR